MNENAQACKYFPGLETKSSVLKSSQIVPNNTSWLDDFYKFEVQRIYYNKSAHLVENKTYIYDIIANTTSIPIFCC